MMGAACTECRLLEQCGGLDRELGLGCQIRCDSCDRDTCHFICDANPRLQIPSLSKVGGRPGLWKPWQEKLPSPEELFLPEYIPSIRHGYGRRRPFESPGGYVALSLYELSTGWHRPGRDLAQAIRKKLVLARSTNLIVSAIAKDHFLEKWWNRFPDPRLGEFLRGLDVSAVTVPNFSLFRDAPRIQTVFNITRMHRFADWLAGEGIPVIPHIHAETEFDWRRWAEMLRDQNHIRYIAAEFQTGFRKSGKADEFMANLLRLQQAVGRSLHIVAVGGAQYAGALASRFDGYSIIDSTPFMKTIHRRELDLSEPLDPRWVKRLTAAGEKLDDLFAYNVARRIEAVMNRATRSPEDLELREFLLEAIRQGRSADEAHELTDNFRRKRVPFSACREKPVRRLSLDVLDLPLSC